MVSDKAGNGQAAARVKVPAVELAAQFKALLHQANEQLAAAHAVIAVQRNEIAELRRIVEADTRRLAAVGAVEGDTLGGEGPPGNLPTDDPGSGDGG